MNLSLISSFVSKASKKDEIMEKCGALSRSSSTDSQGWIMLGENLESTKSQQVQELAAQKLAASRSGSPDLRDKLVCSPVSREGSPQRMQPDEIVDTSSSRASSPEMRESFIEELSKNFRSIVEVPKEGHLIRSRTSSMNSSTSVEKTAKEAATAFMPKEAASSELRVEKGAKKNWHRKAAAKPSNIEYHFPKIEALARENPTELISQFFKDAKRLEEINPTQLEDKERIQSRMRRVQDLAISHIRTMNHREISEFLASPLFSSNVETNAVEYPLKHALLAEFSIRAERDYKALQDTLLRNGKPLNMVVFRNSIPDPAQLQNMGRVLGKEHIKVVGIDSNPTITRFPKSLRALGDIEEIRVSDSPKLTNPSVPKELFFLKSVILNGRSYSLKPGQK